MVFVNGKKFACESCVKGHRSSSCHHSERPLFEIKKKGRPVSQCEKCRELRQTKRVHSKCVCDLEMEDKKSEMKLLSMNSKRYIPIRPTLPNGLKDVLDANKSNIPPDPRAQVETLLNPCRCKDVWSCKCGSNRSEGSLHGKGGGLVALAQAAAMCCSPIDPAPSTVSGLASLVPSRKGKEKESRSTSCCHSSPPPSSPSKRRPHRTHSKDSLVSESRQSDFSLPPILAIPETSAQFPFVPPPSFFQIPSLGSMASLAGTGCTCGFDCTCPGCVEHRGSEHVEKNINDCPDSCGSCIDHQHGLELPAVTALGTLASSSSSSFIDAFFARASANIPPPPAQRAFAINLDPTNVTVYPKSLFDHEARNLGERGPAFGLVQLPKLECCDGRCGCPGDSCGCGESCNGCCSDHNAETQGTHGAPAFTSTVQPSPKSCCSS